ncbi:MAG TPA: hypothetical protein VFL29_10450 [Candidatus Dormibacteraeota bacterium]|nr:hypothetical protein [Candidatus Dormibacteraeota bacterium]
MRAALGALAAIALLVPGCVVGNPCDACPTQLPLGVLLTDADAGAVISVRFDQNIGVELAGSGRTIKASDSKRMQSTTPSFQPGGKTLRFFNAVATATLPSRLESFGGTEVLSAPAQGANPAWQVTLVIGSDVLGFSVWNVETLGESWVYAWPIGGQPPVSTNAQVVAPSGPPVEVTKATLDFTAKTVTVNGTFEQQMYYAAAPGKAFLTDPFNRPLANNESLQPYEVIVKVSTDWSCTVASGCTQTVVGASQWPDQHYTYGQTPPP